MANSFGLIFEEYSLELGAISGMVQATEPTDTPKPPAKVRIAAANSATLLLAAVFEDYIRQQVVAAFEEKRRATATIEVFPKDIAKTVWRRTLDTLSKVDMADVEANPAAFEAKLLSVIDFSLKKKVDADIGEALAHHQNNMRPDQLTSLFNQIGVSKVLHKSCDDAQLQSYLGKDNRDAARDALANLMNDFFVRRNRIAHAIQIANTSSGAVQLSQDIELFSIFGKALQLALEAEFAPAVASVAVSTVPGVASLVDHLTQ